MPCHNYSCVNILIPAVFYNLYSPLFHHIKESYSNGSCKTSQRPLKIPVLYLLLTSSSSEHQHRSVLIHSLRGAARRTICRITMSRSKSKGPVSKTMDLMYLHNLPYVVGKLILSAISNIAFCLAAVSPLSRRCLAAVSPAGLFGGRLKIVERAP